MCFSDSDWNYVLSIVDFVKCRLFRTLLYAKVKLLMIIKLLN